MSKINPIEELGRTMQAQMRGSIKANQMPSLELGTIGGNMSLLVDSLSNAIPKGEYMVSLRLTIPTLTVTSQRKALATETAAGPDSHSHSIKEHDHKVTIQSQLRAIKAGDRVLVAWCGTEPVVVDIVVSS